MKIVELLIRENLPRKNFFHSSEIISLLNIKPKDISDWESEFPQIRMQKTESGQRLYRREDVVRMFAINHLVNEKKLSIASAKNMLAECDEGFFLSLSEKQSFTKNEEIILPSITQEIQPITSIDDSEELVAESICIDKNEEFDEKSHQIYQAYGDELKEVALDFEPAFVGEMIKDAIQLQATQEKNLARLKKVDMDKAVALLTKSKQSLTEVLVSLEKYRESIVWADFFKPDRVELNEIK